MKQPPIRVPNPRLAALALAATLSLQAMASDAVTDALQGA